MAINYLSDKIFLSNAATSDVSFGSNNSATAAWSDKPLCLAGKTMAGGSETKDLGNGEIDVWNWSGSAWVFKQHITHPDYPSNYSHFGTWLAMDKSVLVPTVLVIGSHDKSGGGKAYIFTRPDINTNFQHVTSFVASDAGSNDQFGIRIAVDEVNGVIAVAATSWDDPVYSNAGKIYLYEAVDGVWPGSIGSPATEDASVVLPGSELLGNNYYLGNGLALCNGHLFAAGRGFSYQKLNYYQRASKTSWPHQQTIEPSNDGYNNYGICDLDMDSTGTYAVVGAGSGSNSKHIWLLKRTGAGASSWTEIDTLIKTGNENFGFGQCVKMSPTTSSVAVSSAAAWFNNGIGRAWIIPIVADALDDANEKVYEAAAPWRENVQYFGSALGWNGHHLAVGACGDDEAAENAGALYQSFEGGPYPGSIDPVITPTFPTAGQDDVAKNEPIVFTVTDEEDDLDVTTIKAWVLGVLVFKHGWTSPNWSVSMMPITNGYQIAMAPNRLAYYRDGEEIGVRAYAEDTSANSDDKSWSFTATKTHVLRIYPMLFDGTRKIDEESN